ncbi:MAG TPA: methyltransferase domain-containing protein, partial [Ignavibacteria bacterium]|nr:methyltransferase domain-containing protein [Ignavibacteria bacterium]
MDTQSTKYLPGGFDQYLKLSKAIDLNNKKILFIGSGLERLLLKIDLSLFPSVYYIIEDHESLISTRYLLSGIKGINIRMMEFDNTDFSPDEFDVVYVQGSIASDKRNKIVKEVKRILKPGGVFCVGESVKLVTDIPQFVKDMYDNSGIAPL